MYPAPASSPHQLFTVPAALVVRQGTQLSHLGCQLSGLHRAHGCVLVCAQQQQQKMCVSWRAEVANKQELIS